MLHEPHRMPNDETQDEPPPMSYRAATPAYKVCSVPSPRGWRFNCNSAARLERSDLDFCIRFLISPRYGDICGFQVAKLWSLLRLSNTSTQVCIMGLRTLRELDHTEGTVQLVDGEYTTHGPTKRLGGCLFEGVKYNSSCCSHFRTSEGHRRCAHPLAVKRRE